MNNNHSKLMVFFNSPLGLWLLSSVVLTFLTGIFAFGKTMYEEEVRKAQLVDELDMEISCRIEPVDISGISLFIAGEINVKKSLPNEILGKRNSGNACLEKFKDRSLQSLLYELATLFPKRSKEREEIYTAIYHSSVTYKKFWDRPIADGKDLVQFFKVAGDIKKLRWTLNNPNLELIKLKNSNDALSKAVETMKHNKSMQPTANASAD